MKFGRLLVNTAVAAALVGAGVGVATAACSSASVDYPVPQSFAVYDGPTCYVGYQYDPLEVQVYPGVPSGCTAVLFPSVSFVPAPGSLAFLMATHLARYDSFYHSGYWYDQYYSPLAPRYHVHLSVTKTTFISNSQTFEHTYASQIREQSARATYVNSHGRPVKNGSSYKFPSSNSKAANRPLTNTGVRNGGSQANTSVGSRQQGGSAYSRPLSNSGSRSGGISSGRSSGGRR